jgi:hypothetical protein
VAPQYWILEAVLAGTFDDPVQAAHATYFADATTQAFDRSVVASTGDPELRAAYADAGPVHLRALKPGTAGTIRVTITPAGSPGDVVRGTVYVDTVDPITGSTAEIVALPYAYTVG